MKDKLQTSVHRRLLSSRDDDPLTSVANLFDVAMVFAVALLLAMVSRFHLTELLNDSEVTLVKNPGQPDMEIVYSQGKELTHYKLSEKSLKGNGERLGTAYRLKTGEVVYVPE
ncbi:MAG: DUF2149 domain-containing protein [Planctomycetaceae bacterium]|nr:DUF2149 domain-containing protein [Planctomycetaceae bacterium]